MSFTSKKVFSKLGPMKSNTFSQPELCEFGCPTHVLHCYPNIFDKTNQFDFLCVRKLRILTGKLSFITRGKLSLITKDQVHQHSKYQYSPVDISDF